MVTVGAIAGIIFSCAGGSLMTRCIGEFANEKRKADYTKHEGEELDEKAKKKMNFKDHVAFIAPIAIGTAVSAGLSILSIAADEALNNSDD